MKYLFPILFVTVIACNSAPKEAVILSPQEQAQASVSDWITEELGPENEYTPVGFKSIDSLYSSPNMDSANLFVEKSKYFSDLAMEYLGMNIDQAASFTDSSLYYSNMALDYLENFPKEFQGWSIEHEYNAIVKGESKDMVSIFYLDTAFTITGTMPKALEAN